MGGRVTDNLRPIPGDMDADLVMRALNLSDVVYLAQPGPIDTFAAETWQNDGTGFQTVFAIQLQARLNHDHATDATKTVTVMVPPENAASLLEQLLSTVEVLMRLEGEQA